MMQVCRTSEPASRHRIGVNRIGRQAGNGCKIVRRDDNRAITGSHAKLISQPVKPGQCFGKNQAEQAADPPENCQKPVFGQEESKRKVGKWLKKSQNWLQNQMQKGSNFGFCLKVIS